MPTKIKEMKDWMQFFDEYGKDLMRAMPAGEIAQWYGEPFTYWLTHNYSYGKEA